MRWFKPVIETKTFKPIPWWKLVYLKIRYGVKKQVIYGRHLKWIQESIIDSKGVVYIIRFECMGTD